MRSGVRIPLGPLAGQTRSEARGPQGLSRSLGLIGVSVREYGEIEAGDREPSLETYRRISELYGWPARFEGRVKSG